MRAFFDCLCSHLSILNSISILLARDYDSLKSIPLDIELLEGVQRKVPILPPKSHPTHLYPAASLNGLGLGSGLGLGLGLSLGLCFGVGVRVEIGVRVGVNVGLGWAWR